jgi:hypothetical protein
VAKHDPIEQALDRLSALKSAPADAALLGELRTLLRHRSNLVVAKAAKLTGQRRLADLLPDLVAAFHKLMGDAPRLDKRCEAVTEIVSALYEMDYSEPDVYRQGLRHVQMEASFGPPVDAAAHLRGLSAMGLVRTRDREAQADVVALLVDSATPARIGAIRALATNGGDSGALVLRLKVLTGDVEPEVMAECFSGLLASYSASTVAFVARYVDNEEPAIAEAAILALGASRGQQAFQALKEKWDRTRRGPVKKVLLFALSNSRNEDALQFLLGQLETASAATAAEVLSALAAQRPSESIRNAIHLAVQRRADASLTAAYNSAFPAE